jgi:hypothetical protein
LDIFCAFKVSDGPGHFQNPRVSPGTQPELVDGQLQEFLAALIDLAELLDMAVGHLGIAVNIHPFESIELILSSRIHPSLDLPRGVSCLTARQISIFDGRDLDVDIDPVHQRAGDLRPVPLNLRDRAGAFMIEVTVVTARTAMRDTSYTILLALMGHFSLVHLLPTSCQSR